MKKSSQVLVLAMSAVFALTACERRTRPAKPKSAQKAEENKDKGKQPGNTTPGTEQPGANNTGGAQPVAPTEKEALMAAQADLFGKGFEDYAKQGFTLDEFGLKAVKNGEMELPLLSMNIEGITKRIKENAEKLAAEAKEGEITPNADALAQKLSDSLAQTQGKAQIFIGAYRNEKGEVKAVKDVSPDYVKGLVEAADSIVKSIDTLQEVLVKDFAVKLK